MTAKNILDAAQRLKINLTISPVPADDYTIKQCIHDVITVTSYIEQVAQPQSRLHDRDEAAAPVDCLSYQHLKLPFNFPYQKTFDAIGAAVNIEAGGAIGISVEKFQQEFNK